MTASVSAGCDPDYLINAVGGGAENYYLKAVGVGGEPPGVWQGDAAEMLGLSGEIDPDVMRALYTHLTDPRQLETVNSSLSAIEHEPGTPEWQKAADKIRAAARLGSKLRDYSKSNETRVEEALAKLPADATPEERRATELAVRRDSKAARPYIDVTYGVPKSVTIYHASLQLRASQALAAGDHETYAHYTQMADDVWDCVMEGVQAGNQYLQENAGYARAGRWQGKDADGKSTGRRVDAHEFVIASFRQHTNRDDEMHMHVHNAILNRVPTTVVDPVTGEETTKWMSLDGQLIFQHAKAAGHIVERVTEEALVRKHGVRVATRPDGTTREIMGISPELREHHSGRSRAVKSYTAELAAAYEERYGHAPSARVLAQMAQEATLKTRAPKMKKAPSREELLDRWEQKTIEGIQESLRDVPERVAEAAAAAGTEAMPFDPDRVTRDALEALEEQKPHWRRNDLLVEISRQIPDCLGGLEPAQLRSLVEELTDSALAPGSEFDVKVISPPELFEMPKSLCLENGESIYSRPGGLRYSTGRHWDAEQRLAQAIKTTGAPTLDRELIEQVISEKGLSESQAKALRGIASSGRLADRLVGPAGTGKSYSMAALAEAWEQGAGRPVIGLATSQNAADVLKHDGISNTANLAKFLIENENIRAGRPGEDADLYRIKPGHLVIVDESSMVDTSILDKVRELVEAAGGKMLLAGDFGQLSAVGAGGAFAQLVDEDEHTYVLEEVRRFTNEWEREASLRLRDGDIDVLAEYEDRGRLRFGTREEMMRLAYQDWLADTMAGHTSAMTAVTNEDAAELATRARQDLIRLGEVEDEDGIDLHNGTAAGRGDRIALRRIDRDIVSESGERVATNRDTAKVVGISDNGAMLVQFEDGDRMHLPATYVREHVELAYAGTDYSVQGATEGTGGMLVDEHTTRNALYVGLSRGREENRAYVILPPQPQAGISAPSKGTGASVSAAPVGPTDGMSVLAGVLNNDATERSAHTVARQELEHEGSLTKWGGVWKDLASQDAEKRYGTILLQAYGEDGYRQLRGEEGYGSLMRLTRHAADQGRDAELMLQKVTGGRGLEDAGSGTAVLHWRLEKELEKAEKAEARQREQEIQSSVDEHHQQVSELMQAQQLQLSPLEEMKAAAERNLEELKTAAEQNLEELKTAAEENMAELREIAERDMAELREITEPTQEPADDPLMAELRDIEAQHMAEAREAEARQMAERTAAQQASQQQAAAALQVDMLSDNREAQVRHELAETQREAAEERADWRTRAKEMIGDIGDLARRIAGFREDRRTELGRQLAEAEQRPEWAERLGPVPTPENKRFHKEWIRRAGTVAAYREAHGYTADRDAIGPRPPRGSVDARTDWDSAFRALGEPEERMDLVGATDAQLREMTERYEREEAWAPRYVGDQLRETHLSVTDWKREAVQARAAARETDDPDQRQELEAEARNYDLLAEQMGQSATKLEKVHQARQGWHQETQLTRERAHAARRELDLRTPETPEEPAVDVEPQDRSAPDLEDGRDAPSTGETPRTREEPEAARLTGEELDQAVNTADRAQEILAERAAARVTEQTAEGPAPAPAVEPAPEVSVEPPQMGL
ncbi:MobF family relaxase [Streptomyces antimycoticus]|uniref:MobF family relaxase n=1 Tax=Streptomyces antimycoticus TaxID=68175 RepID=UPI0037D664E5